MDGEESRDSEGEEQDDRVEDWNSRKENRGEGGEGDGDEE